MSLIPSPDQIQRSLQNPFTWVRLAVDLLPIYAVFALGWGAAPLVVLFWMVNAIIGFATLTRMFTIGALSGIFGVLAALFMCAFFTVHYGMFWFGHGVFVLALMGNDNAFEADVASVFEAGLNFAPAMTTFVAIYAVSELINFGLSLYRGDLRRGDLGEEMFAPYGRVVVLHIGIFAGAFALLAIGDPAIGVIALILLHAAFNFITSVRARVKGETGTSDPTGQTTS